MNQMKSWYKFDSSKLTTRQYNYLVLLENTYIIRDAKGVKVPYRLMPHQQAFHSNSLLALEEKDWRNRWVIKSRGIGQSISAMIDYITYASMGFEEVVFPITSYRFDASCELLRKAGVIIRDTQEEKNIDFRCNISATSIKFYDTGSELKAIPGGSESSARSFRSPAILLDELAFYQRPSEMFTAAENVVTEGGVVDCISTVDENRDFFYTNYQKYKENNLGHVYEFPLFDPEKFNEGLSLNEQKEHIIAPWYNINDLETKRQRDLAMFMREYMCRPIDEGSRFFTMSDILSGAIKKIPEMPKPDYGKKHAVLGIDPSAGGDMSGIEEMTLWDDVWYETYKDALRMELPDLQEYVDNLIRVRDPLKVVIDKTGVGTQLFQFLYRKYGGRIYGVQFKGRTNESQKTIEYLFINLRSLIQTGQVKYLEDEQLYGHLNGWSTDLNKYHGEAHGDRAVAMALAVADTDVVKMKNTNRRPVSTFLGGAGRFGGGGGNMPNILKKYRG